MMEDDWVTRPSPDGDLWTEEINLDAPLGAEVPLIYGDLIERWIVPETRVYTIAEIRTALGL